MMSLLLLDGSTAKPSAGLSPTALMGGRIRLAIRNSMLDSTVKIQCDEFDGSLTWNQPSDHAMDLGATQDDANEPVPFLLLQAIPPKPAKPIAASVSVPGSGVGIA